MSADSNAQKQGFLTLYGTSLLDTGVSKWLKLSVILIIMFGLVEGVTWAFIAFDLIKNGIGTSVQWGPWLGAVFIGLLIGAFAIQLDRSIFMLDLNHLRFALWKREAEREQMGENEFTPPPEHWWGVDGRLFKSFEKKAFKLAETLTSIPLLGDVLEMCFSIVRLPVILRLFLVSLTFISSVIASYTTFGSTSIIQKQFIHTLEVEARNIEESSKPQKQMLQDAYELAKTQCEKDTQNRDQENNGTSGSGKKGAGRYWERLGKVAESSCKDQQVKEKNLEEFTTKTNQEILNLHNAIEQLGRTGGLQDEALLAKYKKSVQSAEKSYSSRFEQAAKEAAEAPLFILRPSDWSKIHSPAQLIHFFYLIFFLGMLMIKLTQSVSVAAYFNEEVQNAWSDPVIRGESPANSQGTGYTFHFARWYFRTYYLEQLRSVQHRVQLIQNFRRWRKVKDECDSKLYVASREVALAKAAEDSLLLKRNALETNLNECKAYMSQISGDADQVSTQGKVIEQAMESLETANSDYQDAADNHQTKRKELAEIEYKLKEQQDFNASFDEIKTQRDKMLLRYEKYSEDYLIKKKELAQQTALPTQITQRIHKIDEKIENLSKPQPYANRDQQEAIQTKITLLKNDKEAAESEIIESENMQLTLQFDIDDLEQQLALQYKRLEQIDKRVADIDHARAAAELKPFASTKKE